MTKEFIPFFPYFAALLGLILGSFYTVCTHRYLTGQSIVLPASHCPQCNTPLHWYENIPVLSFLLQFGACRTCKAKISLRYPLLELTSGLWAYLTAVHAGFSILWLFLMCMGGILLVASAIDMDSYILPDILTLPGAALALSGALFIAPHNWIDITLGAGIGSGSFFVLQRCYRLLRGKEGLGTGDIKLMVMLGALSGLEGLPIVIVCGALSAIIFSLLQSGFQLVARLFSKSLDNDETPSSGTIYIPFGPFLTFGCMVEILWGDSILSLLI